MGRSQRSKEVREVGEEQGAVIKSSKLFGCMFSILRAFNNSLKSDCCIGVTNAWEEEQKSCRCRSRPYIIYPSVLNGEGSGSRIWSCKQLEQDALVFPLC